MGAIYDFFFKKEEAKKKVEEDGDYDKEFEALLKVLSEASGSSNSSSASSSRGSSSVNRDFSRLRKRCMGNVSGLREVKNIKARCMRGY